MTSGPLRAQVPACLLERLGEDVAEREVLEDGHDVRESFVEGEDVRVRRLEQPRPQPVDHRMRGLVRDDVLGEAGEDGLAREVGPHLAVGSTEVAEQQRMQPVVVVGVAGLHRMGVDAQPPASLE